MFVTEKSMKIMKIILPIFVLVNKYLFNNLLNKFNTMYTKI
jgi:hypothetical protein